MFWSTGDHKHRQVADRLATLVAEIPENAKSIDGVGVLVSLWCGRETVTAGAPSNPVTFAYGFTSGEVVIDLVEGRISSKGRLSKELHRVQISDQSEVIAVSVGRSPRSRPKAQYRTVGSRIDETIPSRFNPATLPQLWAVADSGYNFWTVNGLGLSVDGVLENRILGDDLLCHLEPGSGTRVEAVIAFRCTPRDICLTDYSEKSHRVLHR